MELRHVQLTVNLMRSLAEALLSLKQLKHTSCTAQTDDVRPALAEGLLQLELWGDSTPGFSQQWLIELCCRAGEFALLYCCLLSNLACGAFLDKKVQDNKGDNSDTACMPDGCMRGMAS